jgi:hypothetical protein
MELFYNGGIEFGVRMKLSIIWIILKLDLQ